MAAVPRQAVSAVESGHTDPSLRVALALARALGLTVEQLFGPGEPSGSVVGFSAWREGLALRPDLGSTVTLDTIAREGLRIVNREPGAGHKRVVSLTLSAAA